MKKLFLIIIILLSFGCQREKMNEVGVGYNKTLIIPPSDDLPKPGSSDEDNTESSLESGNLIVNSILEQTEANDIDESIIDKIDEESGYKTDENFFQWLFKGKSKR
tara:strand:- start:1842 stop:2159 length:318 start_codon:yes stop_codon:yes gene_type:complete